MRRLASRCLALLLPAAFLIASTVRGQDVPSHEIDPDLTPPKNISKLLDPKRLKGKGGNFDVEMMRKLLEFMPRDIDPKDVNPELVKQFLKDNPEFNKKENIDKLRDLAGKQMREPRNPNDPNPPVDWRGVQDHLKKIDDVRQKQPVNPLDPREPVEPPVAKQDPPRNREAPPPRKKEDKESQDFAKWAAKNFGNSPEMRNMAKDFGKIMGGDKKNGAGGFLKDIEKDWKSMTGTSPKNSGGSNSNLKDIANRMKLPDMNANSGGSGRSATGSNSSGGDFSSSPSSSSGGGWNFGGGSGGGSSIGFLVLGLLAVGGVLLYLYSKRHQKLVEETPSDTPRAWPVDPMQVNSREDMVKAFEFLSISKCGDHAVNWHHLQIAGHLGTREPSHRDAADRLARLYEKARYAPAKDLFDDLDIAEARARLSQFAGAPSA